MSTSDVVAALNTGLAAAAPSTTNANSDTPIAFAQTANHWMMQNNSGAVVYYDFEVAATTSSIQLPNNAIVWWDWPIAVLHVLTVAAENINGAAGIVIRARG